MTRKKWIAVCAAICLAMLTGCGKEDAKPEQTTEQQSENTERDGTEAVTADDDSDVTGQGFRPPQGSHKDSNGNIVDQEGNTYTPKGEWTVPEGGHIDSQGRIYDKDGNLMGGGATIGSQG